MEAIHSLKERERGGKEGRETLVTWVAGVPPSAVNLTETSEVSLGDGISLWGTEEA